MSPNAREQVMTCPDCEVDPWMFEEDGRLVHEDFYVSHKLWTATCPDDECHDLPGTGKFAICIGCFERRLGRPMTRADFTVPPSPMFGVLPPSQRFVSRWAAPPSSSGPLPR